MSSYCKPCPFCGSEAKIKIETSGGMPGSIYDYAFVDCSKCKARGPEVANWGNPLYISEARVLWNNQK